MMQNFDTGHVRLRLACADGRVRASQISSERPDVSRVLCGRTEEQAEHLIPLLFALCGRAQTQAARLAVAAARGKSCEAQISTDVQHEALRELLWRCLLDLPPLLGDDPLQQEFVAAVRCVKEGARAELLTLLNSAPVTSLRLRAAQMDGAPTSVSRTLPPLDAASSLAEWPRLNTEFCRRPEWRGAAAETGAIARRAAPSASFFAAHWLARFDELRDWAGNQDQPGCAGTVSAEPVAPGIGRALVETARGLLIHEVVLDGAHIAEYLIVAPTEWNFHPHGAMHDCLFDEVARDREALQQHVARLVATLDPCVPWELEWA
jgi:hypothetical protein